MAMSQISKVTQLYFAYFSHNDSFFSIISKVLSHLEIYLKCLILSQNIIASITLIIVYLYLGNINTA